WSKPVRSPVPANYRREGDKRLPVPILKQGDILIASIQAALSDQDLVRLQEELSERVGRSRSRGAETVVVGIQPEVAFAMVQLGLTLEGVATALDLEEGCAMLRRETKS